MRDQSSHITAVLTRVCLITALLLMMAARQATANEFAKLGDDVDVPLPTDWILVSDSTGFPAQMIYANDSAEILFFRSVISEKDMIDNEKELRTSVDMVVDEVINTLPDGQLLTTTGFYDVYRTGFTLEFLSTDSTGGVPLKHSLRGIIYRHPDQYQLLFTVWGKAERSGFDQVKSSIEAVQDGFSYRGEYEGEVFAADPITYWPILLVVMAIIGVILVRPPWRRKKQPAAPTDSQQT